MPKKCLICGSEAKFAIKGTNDYYCEECAEESFSDISLLEKVEERKAEMPFDEEEDGDFSDKAEDDGEEEFEEE